MATFVYRQPLGQRLYKRQSMHNIGIGVQRALANERHIFVRSGDQKTRHCELARLVFKMAAHAICNLFANNTRRKKQHIKEQRICMSGAHRKKVVMQGRAVM